MYSTQINKTAVSFDSDLKNAILQMREENVNNFKSLLISKKYTDILEGQKIIRNWFITNQNLINMNGKLKNSSTHMPNFFALLLANLCDLSDCNSWGDVTTQLKELNKSNSFAFCDLDGSETDSICCACSHMVNPEHTFILKNHLTSFQMLLGCDCGEKTTILKKGEFKKMSKPDNYKLLQNIRDNKNRLKLLKKRKDNEATKKWQDMSNRLCYLNKNYKKCIDCDQLNISNLTSIYKVRCLGCYIKFKHPDKKIKGRTIV